MEINKSIKKIVITYLNRIRTRADFQSDRRGEKKEEW